MLMMAMMIMMMMMMLMVMVPLVELLVLVVELLGKLLVLLVRTSNGSSKALLVLAVEISVSLGSQRILAVSEFKQRHWLIRDFKSITTIPWRIVELGSCAGSRCQEKCCCERSHVDLSMKLEQKLFPC